MTEPCPGSSKADPRALPASSARLSALLDRADLLLCLADYGIAPRDIEAGVALTISAEQSGAFDQALEWQRQFDQIAAAAGVTW